MTPEEAISIITQIKGIITNDNSWSDVAKATVKEAFDLAIKTLEERPQGDFTRKELESWLYRIASNNIDNELGRSCEEIIYRLNGFERFVSDMRKGGAE